jgi:F-type H+-transporting ATPase subunit gamma
MAQLKEIRSRISSIQNTRQVTSAMKMVSAAKLKKSQDAILQIRPYVSELNEIINSIALDNSLCHTPLCSSPAIDRILLVIIGSNRGLCGGFNANVVKKAVLHLVGSYYSEFRTGRVSFFAIGRQVEKELNLAGIKPIDTYHELVDKWCDYSHSAELTQRLMNLFKNNEYQHIDLVHNVFKNAAIQIPTVAQFLPVLPPTKTTAIHRPINYLFEPNSDLIVGQLIPKMLKMNLFEVLLDSIASEHGARMTAMHQATDNATDMIKDLKMKYNNARQAAITNEILEITAGAEALRNQH